MKLLALDPSSTLTGYAVFEDGRLLHAGWLKPQRVRDAPIDRITAMADDLADQLRETLPHTVVIEIPSGHVGRKRHKGGGAGLAIYGMAVGALWAVCDRHVPPVEVVPVTEEQWTCGTPKPARQRAVAARYADYAEIMAADKGGDVADAIALGEWYLAEQSLRESAT